MKNSNVFPFSAIAGQQKAKKALILNVINPAIGGVLLSGEKGTAKSTLVRALAEVMGDMSVINLPLNVTEDRLVGSIDLKKAVKEGRKTLEEGLLKKAHHNFLYIDEVNLLSEHIVNILLEVSSTGVNFIEREGISYAHPSEFIFAGSMNPEEGVLRAQFIDRFGLYVEMKGEEDISVRTEIMKRRLKYENNPKGFCKEWETKDNELKITIENAKERLPEIKVYTESLYFAARLSKEGGCAGNRAEIILMETAKALAALEGKERVEEKDIKEAAFYVLPHRIRQAIEIEEENTQEEKERQPEEICQGKGREEQERYQSKKDTASDDTPPAESNVTEDVGEEEEIVEAQGIYPKNLIIKMEPERTTELLGSGKRSKVRAHSTRGRYVKYRIPHGKIKDIAFDATLRIAAYSQKNRTRDGQFLCIRPEDFREKVREKRTGATILFVVDASGSMGAGKRMGIVKSAVLSLLNDAYQKRDKVGVIAFRKQEAQVLLNITRSVDLAQKCLNRLPTGGKTPLALGLYRAFELLKAERMKNKDILQYLILVSDGRANIPLSGTNSFEDALEIAGKFPGEKIKSMVLDTESGYIQYGFAEKLSKIMDSQYVKIDTKSKMEIQSDIKNLINIK